MDYKTKPTSRNDLRLYAKYLRNIFGIPETGPFPVLEALEMLPDIFGNCNYIVVEDNTLPPQTMARCTLNDLGGFTIEIKESVYAGAFEKHIGAFLGFICHEIAHIFLFKIGFTPIYERGFDNNELPAYCSVEWQAKALCAEVMIPFEESKGLTCMQIVEKYKVSKAFAKNRKKLERRRCFLSVKK